MSNHAPPRLNQALQLCLFLFAVSTLISQSAVDLFATLFVLLAIPWLWMEKGVAEDFRKIPGQMWLLIWFAAVAVSSAVNASTSAWHKLFDFRWVLLAAMIGVFLRRSPPWPKFWRCLGVVFAAACAFAILVFFLGYNPVAPHYEMDRTSDGTMRTGGFLIQPIVFAHLYAEWLLIFVGAFLMSLSQSWRQKSHVQLSALILLGCLAILLSFTRGAWLGIFVAVLVMSGFLKPKWFLVVVSASLVLCFGLLMVWPTVQDRAMAAFTGEGERQMIWQANWAMFLDHPWFGVGYGENPNLVMEYYQRLHLDSAFVSHAHNQYLQMLVGTGVFGFAAYLGFWIFVFRWALQSFRQVDHRQVMRAGVLLGVIGVMVCFFFGGLTESNLEHSKIRYTLALVLGLLIWLAPGESEGPKNAGS